MTMTLGAPSGAVGLGGHHGADVEKMRPTSPPNPSYAFGRSPMSLPSSDLSGR